MKEIILKSSQEIHSILLNFQKSNSILYRGQSDKSWNLVPKAGRFPFTNVDDIDLFKHWKRRAIAYLENKQYNDWEFLSIAQHTGFATRLLDWTLNPLVAVFFACNENPNTDGAIYFYSPSTSTIINANNSDPFSLSLGIGYYMPNATSQRIMNQLGHFTIHNKPSLILDSSNSNDKVHRLLIPHRLKSELIFMLNQYGVNYLTLFPDLEGLSKHLLWHSTKVIA